MCSHRKVNCYLCAIFYPVGFLFFIVYFSSLEVPLGCFSIFYFSYYVHVFLCFLWSIFIIFKIAVFRSLSANFSDISGSSPVD